MTRGAGWVERRLAGRRVALGDPARRWLRPAQPEEPADDVVEIIDRRPRTLAGWAHVRLTAALLVLDVAPLDVRPVGPLDASLAAALLGRALPAGAQSACLTSDSVYSGSRITSACDAGALASAILGGLIGIGIGYTFALQDRRTRGER